MRAYILAVLLAVAHGLLSIFLVAGAPLAVRRPRWVKWYLAALAPTAAVNLAGHTCPLTVLEKHLWREAGETPYRGGFVSRYFVEPFYAPGLGAHENTILIVLMTIWCSLWFLVATILRIRPRHSAAN